MTAHRFEAHTDCPRCGRLDTHFLRIPRTEAEDDAELVGWERVVETYEVVNWGSTTRREAYSMPQPMRESDYEVIRICTRCGVEWGQV